MPLVKDALNKKKAEREKIKEGIRARSVQPTKQEKEIVDDIIRIISSVFRSQLSGQKIIPEETKEEIKKRIHIETEKREAFSYESRVRIEKAAIVSMIGLGPIEEYMDDPDVTEIIVQKYNNICIERFGLVHKTDATFLDEIHLQNIINRIILPAGQEVNLNSPDVDATLPDGSRIHATIPPFSADGATLTIRKFQNHKMNQTDYLRLHAIGEDMLTFLGACIKGRMNILISGGTGTGKTTFLNMLSGYIPEDELIITVEDTLELQLKHPNVRRLLTRKSGNPITFADSVKSTLRMRPDRIILGEVRDGAIVDLFSAMSTGHEGSMSTIHANSPENLIDSRMRILFQMGDASFTESAQNYLFGEAIDLIVQLKRYPNGERKVSEIAEVLYADQNKIALETLFLFDEGEKTFKPSGFVPKKLLKRLSYYGIALEETMFEERRE
ncbi:MAG: CpaF family protein [Anaerostipes caccae]